MSQKTLGYGLISVGWMGRVHNRGISQVSERYPELGVSIRKVIAADTLADARSYATELMGFESATDDYHQVINHPDVDVVSICSPNFMHHEIAMAAIKAGKDFWIEKPMGRNEVESREIAEGAIAKNLVTAVGFNYRQSPAVAHARELVQSGKLGDIYNVEVKMIADYVNDPEGAFTWRYVNEFAGSGVLGDLMSHGFDLVQYVVGDITEVSAQSETFIKQRREAAPGTSHFAKNATGALRTVENEDWASGMIRLANDASGTFESSRIAVGPACEYSIEVRGSLGTVRWNFENLTELQVAYRSAPEYGFTRALSAPGNGEFGRFQPGRGISMSFDDLKTIEAGLFVKSVLARKQYAPSASDCYSAAECVAAAKRSIASKTWEKVTQVKTHRTNSNRTNKEQS